MGVLAWGDAVDIGGGRGRLAPAPAASLARVDAAIRSAFGRAADINEAWRSPADADENYRKYIAWLNGAGPWAPIALPGDKSIHCFGFAVDTDDTTDAQMRIWNEHGWFWTVYRNGKLAERWHLEYFPDRDKHRNDPAPAGNGATRVPTEEEQIMGVKDDIVADISTKISGLDTRRDTAVVEVAGDFFVVDHAAGTKWNAIRGQNSVEEAFRYIGWLRDLGIARYDRQAPFTLAGYMDITNANIREDVAAGVRAAVASGDPIPVTLSSEQIARIAAAVQESGGDVDVHAAIAALPFVTESA